MGRCRARATRAARARLIYIIWRAQARACAQASYCSLPCPPPSGLLKRSAPPPQAVPARLLTSAPLICYPAVSLGRQPRSPPFIRCMPAEQRWPPLRNTSFSWLATDGGASLLRLPWPPSVAAAHASAMVSAASAPAAGGASSSYAGSSLRSSSKRSSRSSSS